MCMQYMQVTRCLKVNAWHVFQFCTEHSLFCLHFIMCELCVSYPLSNKMFWIGIGMWIPYHTYYQILWKNTSVFEFQEFSLSFLYEATVGVYWLKILIWNVVCQWQFIQQLLWQVLLQLLCQESHTLLNTIPPHTSQHTWSTKCISPFQTGNTPVHLPSTLLQPAKHILAFIYQPVAITMCKSQTRCQNIQDKRGKQPNKINEVNVINS